MNPVFLVEQLLFYTGFSAAKLSRETFIQESTISKWKTGAAKRVDKANIYQLYYYLSEFPDIKKILKSEIDIIEKK